MHNSIILTGALLLLAGCSSSVSQIEPGGADTAFSEPPGSVPANPTPPSPGSGAESFKLNCEEARFTHLLNIYRVSKGFGKLMVSKAGVDAARWHAQDMINKNYFSHTEPDGRSFSSRTSSFGYGAWAENIAAGNFSAASTFCQWKNSPGHNTNMLSSHHQSIGIGQVTGNTGYGVYWSNCFGGGISDALAEPLTADSNCSMPIDIPGC